MTEVVASEKRTMVDELVELHGCIRHHAAWLLRM